VVDKVGIIPEVGMTFESEVKAYEMYNAYAGSVGFSIRKSQTRRQGDGSICQKYIVCILAKDMEKIRHQMTLQGHVVMYMFSLMSAEKGLGQCKRLYY
jgi:hypothetical protein